MKKIYLNQIFQNDVAFLKKCEEGDIIEFEMPPFCSGDYQAKIYKDELGLYINKKDNYFDSCRDYYLIKQKQ